MRTDFGTEQLRVFVLDLRREEQDDLILGRRVVEPDRAFVRRVQIVVCDLARVQLVPAVDGWLLFVDS
jgi:hypothetical protein